MGNFIMPPYSKPMKTPDQQLKLLVAKGLIVADQNAAKQILVSVGYYRLKGFMLSFRDLAAPGKPFRPGTTFEQIATIAEADHRIRLVLFAGIQRLEPMMRTALTDEMVKDYGITWYAKGTLFRRKAKPATILQRLLDGFWSQTRELYVQHFEAKYGKTQHPPSWMLLEAVTIGTLSYAYGSLKHLDAKTRIAKRFGLQQYDDCVSWFHSISHLRNVVAHHGRIWDSGFSITPSLKGEIADYGGASPIKNHYRLAAQVYVMFSLLKAVNPGVAKTWIEDFKQVTNSLGLDGQEKLGFKPDWDSHPLFN